MKPRSLDRIVDFKPRWSDDAESLGFMLQQALGEVIVDVHHIGSTSIEGLVARDILDLALIVRTGHLSEVVSVLLEADYHPLYGLRREVITLAAPEEEDSPKHHLYLCEIEHPQIAKWLKFRDTLRADKRLRNAYGRLKRRLWTRAPFRTDYLDGKVGFIEAVLKDKRGHALAYGAMAVDDKRRAPSQRIPRAAFLQQLSENIQQASSEAQRADLEKLRDSLARTDCEAFEISRSEKGGVHIRPIRSLSVISKGPVQPNDSD